MIWEGLLSKKSQNEILNLILLCVPAGVSWKAHAGQNHILVRPKIAPPTLLPRPHVQRVLISIISRG